MFLLGALILLTDAYARGPLRAYLNLLLHGRGPVPWYDYAAVYGLLALQLVVAVPLALRVANLK